MLNKVEIFNSKISHGTFDEFVKGIIRLSELKRSSFVCLANVHMLMEAHKDKHFQKVLNSSDIASPDGQPVSLVMNWEYKINQQRVAGMDLLPALLKEAENSGKSVYFYGSTGEVLELIISKAKTDLPNLKIAGYHSPPFRPLTEEEDLEIISKINSAHPDLIFIALGCPKQEKWMFDHKDKVNGCMLGVGQAFYTYCGLEQRLPLWARNLSLEWLYRFYQDPKRLWKRYLLTNSLFIYLVIKGMVIPKSWRAK